MKQQEAIDELRLAIRQQNLYDDDELDDRLLYAWIINQRSLWVSNDLNKGHTMDEQIIQNACLTLEVADRSICPANLTQYHVLRTDTDIPKTIELNNSDGVVSVQPVDLMAYGFSYVNISRFRFSGNQRFGSKLIYCGRYGQRFYLWSKDGASYARYIRRIMVRGLFEDPQALSQFTHQDGTACYSPETDEFPMSRKMWNYIRAAIREANFEDLVSTPTDKVNDSDESLKVDVNGEL